MADLGSLVVRLALMGASEFREDFRRADAAVQNFQRSARSMAEEARSSFGGQAIEAMVRFGAEAVGAFLEAEKASQRLTHAVGRSAGHMPGFASHLEGVADAMERATGVDGDYVKSLQQLALELQVAPALVNRATKAALDWAAATGGSAKSALQLLTNASAENLDQLKKWGVQVDASDVQVRGLSAVLEKFEQVYGGTSEQMHEASKALALNKAAWGDLKEAIGQTLTEMLHFSGVASKSATLMDSLTEFLTSKRAEENSALSQKVAAEEAAVTRIANLTAKIREDEALMFRLAADSPMFDQVAESLGTSRQLLGEMEKDLRRMKGQSLVAPTMRFGDEDGLDVESDLPKKMREATEAAKKANASLLKETIAELNATIEELGNATVDVERVKVDLSLPSAAQEFASGASAAMRTLSEQLKKTAQEQATAFARDALEAQEKANAAWSDIGSRALSALGNAGGMIERAVSAGMAGGPMAALASVLVDVLTQSATFQRIVKTLNGIIQSVADALGLLLEPLLPLVGAVGLVVTALMPLASVLIEFVVSAVEPLTPILVLVSTVLQGLMPVLTVLMQAFLMITNPLMVIAGPVLRGLFDVLKVVALIVLNVAKAIGDVWNGLVGAVQSVFSTLADISVFGVKPLGFLDGWAESLNGARVDTEAMARSISELTGLSYELALAKAKEAQASFENYNATKKATEALDNVPDMWRRQLRTGQSQDRQGPPGSQQPPPTPRPPPPGVGSGPGGGGLVRPPVLNSPVTGTIGDGWNRANDLVGGMLPGRVTQIFNISGYEIGPALQQAQRLIQGGSERRSYNSSGSSTSAAPVRFLA